MNSHEATAATKLQETGRIDRDEWNLDETTDLSLKAPESKWDEPEEDE